MKNNESKPLTRGKEITRDYFNFWTGTSRMCYREQFQNLWNLIRLRLRYLFRTSISLIPSKKKRETTPAIFTT